MIGRRLLQGAALLAASLPLTLAAQPVAPSQIDAELAAAAGARGVEPAPFVGDAAFLRRLSLDVRGTVPTLAELAAFEAESTDGRRERWIQRFVNSPAAARHLGNVLQAELLRSDLKAAEELGEDRDRFGAWLSEQLEDDRGWDDLAAELLAGEGQLKDRASLVYLIDHGGIEGSSVEEVPGVALRQLAGVSLECARCHDHPFNDFRQEDYHRQAAWFARLRIQPEELGVGETFAVREVPLGRHRVKLNGASEPVTVEPAVLPGTPKSLRAGATPPRTTRTSLRAGFVRWLTSPDNPWFARTAVNAMWRRLFGRGLVADLEDPSSAAHPRHAALLERLAEDFARGGFSLRALQLELVRTEAYRRGPAGSDDPARARTFFVAAAVRPLAAEALLDSLLRAAGREESAPGELESTRIAVRARLLEELRRALPARPRGPEFVTAGHGLATINGRAFTALARSRGLQETLRTHARPERRLEALYRRAFARSPTPAEARPLLAYLAEREHVTEAYEDVFWALLGSSEFATNH